MKILVLFPLFVIACVHSLSIKLTTPNPISGNLTLVATVDGKSFYAEQTVDREWRDAGAFCVNRGMKLASITTKAQADALQAAYDENGFSGAFWTSGRDAHIGRQFTWNGTDQQVDDDVPGFASQAEIDFLTCLLYSSDAGNSSGLVYWWCDEAFGSLCEL